MVASDSRIFGLNPGDLATWVAAIGTVGALFLALLQIGIERGERLRREGQERQRRHQAQARLIAAAMGPEEPPADQQQLGRTGIDMFNGSDEPVYRLVVGMVFIQGAGPQTLEEMLEQRGGIQLPLTTVSILPPGTFRVWIAGTGWSSILSGRPGAEMAFTDREGHWIRRATGRLEEMQEDALDYFSRRGLAAPFELHTPERIA